MLSRYRNILFQFSFLKFRFTMNNYQSFSKDFLKNNSQVCEYVLSKAKLCQPDSIHICDGSNEENQKMINILKDQGAIKRLSKYENCWLARTDPADVARVESKTVICTEDKEMTIPITKPGIQGTLGNWISPSELDSKLSSRFPGCMKGRTMYVIPFSMGPVGGKLSKIGIELTDSPYVVASMRIMTRMGSDVLQLLGHSDEFVKCIHSVGVPLPTTRTIINGWPCNPEDTIIAHIPSRNEICSFGSGYGGNSLLGKKCFALRIASIIAHKEGWLAEHMLILGITDKSNVKRYIVAAFPSACGKTNLAMLESALPEYKIECVGDDIAWMKFDDQGILRAINPEAGFFGVAPGTSHKTNPNAMETIKRNTIFTNVAETSDGGVFWEGLEDELELENLSIIDWQGNAWDKNTISKAAHPNSRFCVPASQCPIIDENWQSSEGVPISAIIFGGRRPEGVPLIYEARDWIHGVFLGASLKSESTAAAEYKSNVIMHDPFAMRPFFGYNFGHYLKHWLSFANKPELQLPRIYHVNWFRKHSQTGKFIWPGFGENGRVLDWIFKRLDGTVKCKETLIGNLPLTSDINLKGLEDSNIDMEELFSVPIEFWEKEAEELEQYFNDQVDKSLPDEIRSELKKLKEEILKQKNK